MARPEKPALHPVFAMASVGLVLISIAGRSCPLSSFAEVVTLGLILIIWLLHSRSVGG